MTYYCVDVKRGPDGAGPALPADTDFLVLADVGHPRSPWVIVECAQQVPVSSIVRALPDTVLNTLEGALQYPPALALTRDDLAAASLDEIPSPESFVEEYRKALRRHVRDQAKANYFLAEAVHDEVGYLSRGSFYWVLSIDAASNFVRWVSHDYFIYENPADHFDLGDDCSQLNTSA